MILLFTISGCASVNIPNYIHDKFPYKQTYYAPFSTVHENAVKTLEDLGWKIEKESDPALFERGRDIGNNGREQTLVFTEIRQFSFFIGSGYTRLNMYLRGTADQATEVEIRYLRVTSMMFKNFYNYKNDHAVDRIFKRMEEGLHL
jgi:hypothetical protein